MAPPRKSEAEKRERRDRTRREYVARKKAEDAEGFAEYQRQAIRKYTLANPEKTKAATKKWRLANKLRFNETRRIWRSKNIVKALFLEARGRAKARGVEFTILLTDIPPIGTHCPLLGHPFPPSKVRKTAFSPSLDRRDPMLGYIPGNVWIVGYRANLIKNDGTAEEHEMIAKAMRAYE